MARAITWLGGASVLFIALHVAEAEAAVVAGRVIAIEDGTPTGAGSPATDVLQPFVDAFGEIAFAGTLSGGDSFLFVGDQIAWLATDEITSVTSVLNSVGTLSATEFVLRATIDGEPGLWTHAGALGRAGDPAPGFPLFPTAAFVGTSDCRMDGSGAIYWRANVDITNDGSTDVAGLFHAPDGAEGSIEALYRSGGTVDGITLHGGSSAVADEFAVSDNGSQVAARLAAAGDSLADHLIVVNDHVVAREGDVVPNFPLEHWRALDLVSVDDSGNVLFTGNTDAAAAVDEFVAFNGEIEVHEGDVLDGVGVAFDLRFVALNDRNNAAIGWATTDAGPTEEVVFFACNAADIAGTVRVLVAIGDVIDVDGDAIGDFTVADIVGAGNEASRVLGDREAVYLEVDLDPGDLDAIVEIPVTCCGNGVTDGGEACDDGNEVDDDDCTNDCVLPPDPGTTSGSSSSGDPDTTSGSTSDGTTASSSASTGVASSDSGSDSTDASSTASSSGSSSDSTGAHSTDSGSTGSNATSSETTAAEGSSTDGTTSGLPDTTEADSDATTAGSMEAATEVDDDGAGARADGCGCATSRPSVTLVGLSLLVLGLRRRRASA